MKGVFVPFCSLTSLSSLPVRPHPLLRGGRFQVIPGSLQAFATGQNPKLVRQAGGVLREGTRSGAATTSFSLV